MEMGKKLQRGFTLIELVIVILVLSILAAILVPRYYDLKGDAENAAKNASYGGIRSAFAIALAQVKGFPTLQNIIDQTDGGSASSSNNGIKVDINGTYYKVNTYSTAPSGGICTGSPTTATTDTVRCVGEIVAGS